jgi:Zn-dependent M28 family amino/carboxypeptidase
MLLSGFSANYDNYYNLKPVVSPAQLKEWVSFLASNQMRGRSNGSPEMKTASEWIADKFKENGLKPFDSIANYIQNYTFTSRQKTVNERNIIGFIEGADPKLKNEYIILSAHFDHIGVRRNSMQDSIYNGADDNAAGTCALIGIARTLKKSGLKPGRSIIFAAFSGEESGMRGSRYFVSHSPILLKNIYADLNFEMIGHSEYLGKGNYYMTGCLNSNLDDLIGDYNKNTEFKLIDTISLANNLFYSSDNIAFSRITAADGITTGIPSGTFATTTMAEYIHKPSDEVELFDFDNMAELVNHFSSVVIWLSAIKSEIKWTDPKFVRPE